MRIKAIKAPSWSPVQPRWYEAAWHGKRVAAVSPEEAIGACFKAAYDDGANALGLSYGRAYAIAMRMRLKNLGFVFLASDGRLVSRDDLTAVYPTLFS